MTPSIESGSTQSSKNDWYKTVSNRQHNKRINNREEVEATWNSKENKFDGKELELIHDGNKDAIYSHSCMEPDRGEFPDLGALDACGKHV